MADKKKRWIDTFITSTLPKWRKYPLSLSETSESTNCSSIRRSDRISKCCAILRTSTRHSDSALRVFHRTGNGCSLAATYPILLFLARSNNRNFYSVWLSARLCNALPFVSQIPGDVFYCLADWSSWVWIASALVFDRRSFLSIRPVLLIAANLLFCSRPRSNNRNARLVHWCAKFWWRILLSCRLTRLNLNSIQFSISFKHGVLWRLRGRNSFFWTSPGRFRCIVAMSKSGFGDVWMRTAPRVALRGGKPRRKYFIPRHLTRWTDHVEPKACFILALYRIITSSAVLLKSQRPRGIFLWIHAPSATSLNCAAA